MSRRAVRALTVAASLFVALVLTELAMRVLLSPLPRVQRIIDDPELGWDAVPAIAALENHGARHRVYFLGDSFTQDRRWPALTQQYAASSNVTFDGYTLGVSGYGTTQALVKLKRDFEHHRPQLVLLLFFAWNDLRDNVAYPSIFYSPTTRTRPYFVYERDGITLHPASPLSPAAWVLYRTDVSRRVLLKVLLRLSDRMARLDVDGLSRWQLPVAVNYTERATWEPFYLPGPEGDYVRHAYAVTVETFRQMRRFLADRGAQLGVIGIDNPFVVDADVAERWIRPGVTFDADRPLGRVAELLAAENIAFVSATPALRSAAKQLGKKMYNPPAGELSGHLEPEGEAVVAKLAADMAMRLLRSIE